MEQATPNHHSLRYEEIDQLSPNVTAFRVCPPMLFDSEPETANGLPGAKKRAFVLHEYVVVCIFPQDHHYPYGRAIIHAADKLKGDCQSAVGQPKLDKPRDGFAYGGMGAWVRDGHPNLSPGAALEGLGYFPL